MSHTSPQRMQPSFAFLPFPAPQHFPWKPKSSCSCCCQWNGPVASRTCLFFRHIDSLSSDSWTLGDKQILAMGPKQSSPVADGRTRAYSSSDVPSGTNRAGGFRYTNGPDGPEIRYTGGNAPNSYQAGLNIPSNRRPGTLLFGSSLDDTDGESGLSGGGHRLLIGSLPAHLSSHMLGGFHCPVCSKFVSSDEMELHLLMCLTKPRLSYNEDVLAKDSGECSICLDELEQGDTIARLPCLCIYHKGCIDEWFEVNRSCPEHPSD